MAGVRLERFGTTAAFRAAVEPFLTKQEGTNSLLLAIAARPERAADSPDSDHGPPYFAAVTLDGSVVLAAARTPPYKVVLSGIASTAGAETVAGAPGMPSEAAARGDALARTAVEPLVHDVLVHCPDLPGVIGPRNASRAFAQAWAEASSRGYRLSMAQCIYQLERVRQPASVPGTLRRPTLLERDVLARWVHDLHRHLGQTEHALGAGRFIDLQLARDASRASTDVLGLYVWDGGGGPVSMASVAGPTPHGLRVSTVYTPPERRRQGYASACVAAISQRILDSGRRYCFLFADLANPTANSLYQRIGYDPVCRFEDYAFDPGL